MTVCAHCRKQLPTDAAPGELGVEILYGLEPMNLGVQYFDSRACAAAFFSSAR